MVVARWHLINLHTPLAPGGSSGNKVSIIIIECDLDASEAELNALFEIIRIQIMPWGG